MKKDKIAGTIGTTIFIIVVLVKEVVNPLDWRSLLILFGFFLIWGIIVSASLATFFDDREVSFFGIFKASSKQTSGKELKQRIDALDRQLKSLFNKIESSDRKAQKKITELNDKVSLLSNTLDIQNDKIGTMEAKLKTVEAESTDYHKSFQDLVYKITTPGISYVEKYKTPSEFQKLMDVVKSAKNDGYSVSDDSSYLECVKIVQ